MLNTRPFVTIIAVCTVIASAHAGTTSLYQSVGTESLVGGLGDQNFTGANRLAATTGQKFNPTESGISAIPTTALFDRAALRISVDPNVPPITDPNGGYFNCEVSLWVWTTDVATTLNSTPIVRTNPLTLPGGFTGWLEIAFPPQPANAVYFLGVTRRGLPTNAQWRIVRTSTNSSAANSVAYRPAGAFSDREWATRLHWYDPACATTSAAAITEISGTEVLAGTPYHTMTLTGSNLNTITAVNLVKTRNAVAPILGAVSLLDANTMEVAFDFTSAEAGRYNLVVVHPCDRVLNAPEQIQNDTTGLVPLKGAVLVYRPSLTNGSFEIAYDGSVTPGPCNEGSNNQPKPRDWDKGLDMDADLPTDVFRRDGSFSPPDCVGTTPNGATGEHYASMQINTNFPKRYSVFQTFTPPGLTAQNTLAETINVLVDYKVAGNASADSAAIRLRNGTETGEIIATTPLEFTFSPPDGLRTSTTFQVTIPAGYEFTPNPPSSPPLLTVEYVWNLNSGSNHATHFDNIRIINCNIPFADADGDLDVDMDDFGMFQTCYTGASGAIPADPAYCRCFDRGEIDARINLTDFQEFAKCATQAGVVWSAQDPDCVP